MSRPSREFGAPPRRSSSKRRARTRALRALWVLGWLVLAGVAAYGSRLALTWLAVPAWMAWVALAGVGALGALGFAASRLPAKWGALGIAVVLGAGAGTTAHSLVAPSGQVARLDPDRVVASRVLLLARALEQQAYRRNRPASAFKYPANAEFMAFVQGLGMADDPLENPWTGVVQGERVAPGPGTELPLARAIATGDAELPPMGSRLGTGHMPQTPAYTVRSYGALIYDHDPKSDTFVLYGVGRLGEEAVLVGVVRSRP